ncbi:MAG: hypothetical protein ACJ74U_01855 [Jatrophihabitantaceae bacterium]
MASQPPVSWQQVLAELETETALLAEGLRRGELLSPVTPWHPPVLPPIPAELVVRAQQLLAQQHRLRAEISQQLQAAPAPSRPRSVPESTPVPLLLDLRA